MAVPPRAPVSSSTVARSTRSFLFRTRIKEILCRLRSASIFSTDSIWSLKRGLLISITCRRRSALSSSSRVARKATISSLGRFLMNPTVSVMMTSMSFGNLRRLLEGSNVAKSLLSARTLLFVRVFSRVDFPALVYPMMEMIVRPLLLRFALCCFRCFLTSDNAFSSRDIRFRTRLRFISSFVSPGPRPPIPPVKRDIAVFLVISRGRR